MENITPKIDDALGAVLELFRDEVIKVLKGGNAISDREIKILIINKLREFGVVLSEDKNL